MNRCKNKLLNNYFNALNELNATGEATEHTFRGALENLVNSIHDDFKAINEPKHRECGAPDYVVKKKLKDSLVNIGYIETKSVNKALDDIEKSEQFTRYINVIDNIILTNYIEFRHFVRGNKVGYVVLGELNDKCIKQCPGKEHEFLSLLNRFLSFTIEPISSAMELAKCMAKITHAIRETVLNSLNTERSNKHLKSWREAFTQNLLPDLSQENHKADFADMYAQTIAYGLFAARCHHNIKNRKFDLHAAQEAIPKTNPLLRSLFECLTGVDILEEPYFHFVEDLIYILSATNMENVLNNFENNNVKKDPTIHFYESFLSEYDPKLRDKRGIYYTPEPVVSWLVRSADVVVREKFSIKLGLADSSNKIKIVKEDGKQSVLPKVMILDPSCGTGTFLYKTIELIRNRLIQYKQVGMWSDFVKNELLPRIYGFELLMVPYVVAHFKLSLQLAFYDMIDTGRDYLQYNFLNDCRLHIYLTNTLNDLEKKSQLTLPGVMQTITEEGEMARKIKNSYPIFVIIGNPPYSGVSANDSKRKIPTGQISRNGKAQYKTELTKIGELVENYKKIEGVPIGEKNTKWLNDDYVKFIAWAEWKLEKVDDGVVTFVTNHAYLDNVTFSGMRYSLMKSFDEIYIYDLHGNSRKNEKSPDGTPDENVFDIAQGVAICIFIKRNKHKNKLADVYFAEMYGSRDIKYEKLRNSDFHNTEWEKLSPTSPYYLFTRNNISDNCEYGEFISINDIFTIKSTGIATKRDAVAIHYTPKDVKDTINRIANSNDNFLLNEKERNDIINSCNKDIDGNYIADENKIIKILYRPFDIRYTYYTGVTDGFLHRPRNKVMINMINNENIGIITTKYVKGEYFSHVYATYFPSEVICLSSNTSTNGYLFPMYRINDFGKYLNINNDIISKFKEKFVIQHEEDIFYYTFSIINTPLYQSKYNDFLKYNFPKIPIPHDYKLFLQFADIGKALIEYYTLSHVELDNLDNWKTGFIIPGSNIVTKVLHKDNNVFINSEQYFSGITEEIVKFSVGGYFPVMKWLEDREKRSLMVDDILTYQKIIHSVTRIIKLKHDLDEIWNNMMNTVIQN